MLKTIVGLIAVLLLAACATGYQSKNQGFISSLIFEGGYSETQLAPNAWQVRFKGNGHTSDERAADFTLLRAAELMTDSGHPYFIITDSASSVETSIGTRPDYSTATPTTDVYTVHKPSAAIAVLGYRERPDYPMVYEAAFIAQSIRDKYGLSE